MIARTLPSAIALAASAVICITNLLTAQTASAEAEVLYYARGTGRTTGHVVTLYVANPTPNALRTSVGDCFIPPADGYQGYVIPGVYPVQAPPFGAVAVQLNGYCVNVDLPALAEGAAAPALSQWITWTAADLLPERGKLISTAFVPAAATLDDPLYLTYPGSAIPFTYRLDIDKNPQAAARLLLHKAYAAEKAFDQLQTEGKVRVPAGRATDVFRQEIVQQVLWAYASRLEGKPYSKPQFAAQLTEEAEQQMNQPANEFTPETQQAIERQSQDIWASISLVGAEAKLIPVAEHPADVFKATPAGGAPASPSVLKSVVEGINPADTGAGEQIIPILSYLQNNAGRADMQPELESAKTKWVAFLSRTEAVTALSPPEFLTTVHYLLINPGNTFDVAEQDRYLNRLKGKLFNYLSQQVADIDNATPEYLQRRRTLIGRQKTPWYQQYCLPADPLKKLTAAPEKTSPTIAFNPSNIQLSGESWKHVFPPPAKAAKKKTPLWIPIAGVAGVGTIAYFLLPKKDDGKTPAAPVASPDAVTIPCSGEVDLNLLDNDTGEGIYVSSVGSAAGVAISILDAQRVRIVTSGTGVFNAIYTITDRVSQSANSTITITVTDQNAPLISCPPAVTFEGCGETPAPTLSGQATATDDCDLSPVIGFADELGGTTCDRIITRSWTAMDAGGKNATCSQTITVQDSQAPVIDCPTNITVTLGDQNDLSLTGEATAADACLPAIEPVFSDDLSGMDTCSGVIIRTWTAVDGCGNAATCTQIITVVDDQPPTLNCPSPVSVDCGKQNDLSLTGQATGEDNCTGPISPVFTDNPTVFTGCSGDVIRTWTAVDPAGNSASCTQQISISDLSAPVFTVCPMPITVNCGQQNDLVITGQPVVTDLCNGPSVVVTFTDDLSQFIGCEGTITRTFIAADPCGNTAVCLQQISVIAIPCNFTPTFNIEPAFCGDCNGTALVTMNPPGTYEFVWGNGEMGPAATLLCPGTMEVTVTDLVNGCTEVFTTFIPEQPTLTLTVQQVIPPSGPSSNDGRVSLLITPPGAQAPFLVFVNGMPLGLIGTTFFQITDLPAGDYEIFIVDNGGEGCPSNTVLVVLIPQAMAPPPEISTPRWNPGTFYDSKSVENTLNHLIPEHPAVEPLQMRYAWAPAWGISTGIFISEYHQLRLEAARQAGLLMTSTSSGLTYQTPVQANYTQIGVRKYFPRYHKWTFFQEINAARVTFRSGNTWSGADQQWLATAQQEAFWQSAIGGGLRRQFAPNITLEANLQLAFRLRENARETSWSPIVNIRLHSAFVTPVGSRNPSILK